MRCKRIGVFLFVLFGSSVISNAAVIDDTVKALVDNSYKTEKRMAAMQKEINRGNLRIKELENEIARLKVENNIVKIDAKKSFNDTNSSEFSNIIVSVWAAHLRSGPDRNSSVIGYKRMGEVLKTSGLSRDKEWFKTPEGYIKNTLVQPFDANRTIAVIPIKKTINIRKSPVFQKNNINLTASDVNSIKVFPVLFLNKWYKLKNGQGYVHKRVVKEVK